MVDLVKVPYNSFRDTIRAVPFKMTMGGVGRKSFKMSWGGGVQRELKCHGEGGLDKYFTVDYLKLNVMGGGVIRNQMLRGGGVGKNFRPTPSLSF